MGSTAGGASYTTIVGLTFRLSRPRTTAKHEHGRRERHYLQVRLAVVAGTSKEAGYVSAVGAHAAVEKGNGGRDAGHGRCPAAVGVPVAGVALVLSQVILRNHLHCRWVAVMCRALHRGVLSGRPQAETWHLDVVNNAVGIQVRVEPPRRQVQLADGSAAVQMDGFYALFQVRHHHVRLQHMVVSCRHFLRAASRSCSVSHLQDGSFSDQEVLLLFFIVLLLLIAAPVIVCPPQQRFSAAWLVLSCSY